MGWNAWYTNLVCGQSLFQNSASLETYRSGHNGADSKSVREQSPASSNLAVSARKRKTSRKTCLSFSTKSVLSDGINPSSMDEITCVMKSDFVGLGDGFNFICEADFIQAPLGFHRERKRTISLKTARVRILNTKRKNIFSVASIQK